jgi:hypothetical protein
MHIPNSQKTTDYSITKSAIDHKEKHKTFEQLLS